MLSPMPFAWLVIWLASVVSLVSGDTCFDAHNEDLWFMPGYKQLERAIANEFGGVYPVHSEVNTNEILPKDGTRPTAQVCIPTGVYSVHLDDSSAWCTDHMSAVEGNYDQTNGTITASTQTGYTLSSSWETSKTVTHGVDIKTELSLGFGDDKFGVSVTASTKIDTSESSTFAATASETSTITISENVKDHGHCQLNLKTTSCVLKGSFVVPVRFQGWLRVDFPHKVKNSVTGEEAQTFWVSVDDQALSLDPQALKYDMAVSGTVSLQTFGKAQASCDKGTPNGGASDGSSTSGPAPNTGASGGDDASNPDCTGTPKAY